MYFVPLLGDSYMYIAVVIGQVGSSTLFSLMLLWVSQFTEVTGFVTGVYTMGMSIGGMIILSAVGFTFDIIGPISMVYILLSGCLLYLGIFVVMVVFGRLAKKHISPDNNTKLQENDH